MVEYALVVVRVVVEGVVVAVVVQEGNRLSHPQKGSVDHKIARKISQTAVSRRESFETSQNT